MCATNGGPPPVSLQASHTAEPRVRAGVATLVIDSQQRLLLGKRVEDESVASWQCPGGYLLSGESIEKASRRLCLQKAGIEIGRLSHGPYTNNRFQRPQYNLHTVTLYTLAREHRIVDQQRFNDAHRQWQWFDVQALPCALFLPLENLLQVCDLQQLIRV